MATFRNKRPANCKVCGTHCEVGKGWTEGPPWVTTCDPCSGRVEPSAPKIKVTLDKRGVVIRPTDFLGYELFSKFRTAIEGAKFDASDRSNVAALDKAIKIIPALHAAGFLLDLAPDVTAAVQAKTAQLKLDVVGASERAKRVDEILQARGLALYPFQRQGVEWLASRDGAVLADDMGLGKTIQALTAIPEGAAVLVLGPSVAKGVWSRETPKWRPDLKVESLSGTGSFRFPRSAISGKLLHCSNCQMTFDTEERLDSCQEGQHIRSSGECDTSGGQNRSQVVTSDTELAANASESLSIGESCSSVSNLSVSKTCPRCSHNLTPGGEVVVVNYDLLPADPLKTTTSMVPKAFRGMSQDRSGLFIAHPGDEIVLDVDRDKNSYDFAPFHITLHNKDTGEVLATWTNHTASRSVAIEKECVVYLEWSVLRHVKFSVDLYRPIQVPDNLVLIADEAQMLKSAKSKRGAAFRLISEACRRRGGKVWLLTATPLMNRPPELWSILNAAGLAQEAFGSWANFVRLFDGVQDERWGGWTWGTPLPEAAERLRRVCLRRIKREVLDQLPAKTYREIKVDLDAKSRKALAKAEEVLAKYDRFARVLDDPKPTDVLEQQRQAERDALRETFGDDLEGIEAATDLVRRVGRAGFAELSSARAALAKAKIPAMLEIVEEFEEQDEPLIVFSDFRAPIDFLAKREGWAVITGDTPDTERARIQDEFQAGKYKGVACTIKAGGVAITLTRASNVLFVDLNFTPAWNQQAEDRAYRIGQSRGVVITTLVADHPVDRRLFELLASKSRIVTHSVEAARVQATAHVVNLPTEIDFSELEQASADERRREEEAQKLAEERRKNFEGKRAEIEAQNAEEEKKRREASKKQTRQERWLREANGAPCRLAMTPREHWVVASLRTLADLDPDRALVRNDVGFSASDGSVGHKFAYLAPLTGLTEQQWGLAYTLCCKYHRQIGKFEG